MQATHNLTRIFVALAAVIAFCAVSFGQVATSSPVQVSDQKAGSLLVFPFYGSDGAGGDTRLTITNVGPVAAPGVMTAQAISNQLNVHLFFLDAVCAQADVFLCFTKYQSYSFKASEWDPVTKQGELIAVVVDNNGVPTSYNGLIGNAFVNTTVGGAKWVGNYSPEAFASVGNANLNPSVASPGGTLAGLPLNNAPRDGVAAPGGPVGYDAAASRFAVEFQSPVDSKNQAILTMGLIGPVGTNLGGNAAFGTGVIYRNDEKAFSFTPPGPGCSVITLIDDSKIRIVGGLSNSISTGKTGTAIWSVGNAAFGAAVGLFVTPVQANGGWSGIRTLHKMAVNPVFGGLSIPIFMPLC